MAHVPVVAGYRYYCSHRPTEFNDFLSGVSHYFALEVTGHRLFSMRFFYLLDDGTTESLWTGWFRNGWTCVWDLVVWRLCTPLHNHAGCILWSQMRWRNFPMTQRMIGDGLGPGVLQDVFIYLTNYNGPFIWVYDADI